MIRPPKHANRSLLIKTIVEKGAHPWDGDADWVEIGDELDATPDQVRGWYRRLRSWLEKRGYTVQQYAEQETGVFLGDPEEEEEEVSIGYDPVAQYEKRLEELDVAAAEEEEAHREEVKQGRTHRGEETISQTFDQPTTLDEFVEQVQLDLDQWEITHAKSGVWDGRYSWKVSVKPRDYVPEVAYEEWVERLREDPPKHNVIRYKGGYYERALLQPVVYDAHLEKLFTNGSGITDTVNAYRYVMNRIIHRANNSQFNITQVAVVFGQDFGHIDTPNITTTAGTRMDVSVGRKQGIDARTDLAIRTVRALLNVAPVHAIFVPGNHDRDDTYWLGKIVEAYYHDHPNVSINNGPSPRKYYRWGNSLFMYTHGNEEKLSDLPAIMGAEAPPEMWAKSRYREVFCGHLHRRSNYYLPLTEEKGVVIRWFPSLSKPDEWHRMKGYIGANRGGSGLIYHQEHRLVDEFPVLL